MSSAVAPRSGVRPVLPPLVARGIAFAALCGFGLIHWMVMMNPAEPARAFGGLAVALAVAYGVRRTRWALPAGLIAALLVGGVPLHDLWIKHWDELVGSIGDGLDGVAGARIPYPGIDPDLRLVIPLGGTVLAVIAAALAFWPRKNGHRFAALVTLVVLYAVPAVAVELRADFLRGALLAVLVLAFLRFERLAERELAAAGATVALAAVLALAAAPALDTNGPWFDYENFAQDAINARSTSFTWDHDYASLPWSRDGREMLRVQAPRRTYWKVESLEDFDGFRWMASPRSGAPPPVNAELAGVKLANIDRWTETIKMTVRNIRSPTLPVAGVTTGVTFPGRTAAETAPGVWSVGRDIHRGDAYTAKVYVPAPSRDELEAAPMSPPHNYPLAVLEDLSFNGTSEVTNSQDGFQAMVRGFKDRPGIVTSVPIDALHILRNSNLRRIWALSQRLEDTSATPYAYVRAIQRYLGKGFRYDETPPRAARTLDGFLFDAKAGFCQQYSGAMALLLRMGGVPARVATGFAPGSYDDTNKSYIVRDLDAHSWVEAWFSGIGWVVFDPTPSSAPPRSQALGTDVSAGNGDIRDRGTYLAGTHVAPPKQSTPWGTIVLSALGAVLLIALGTFGWFRRAARLELHESELERVLRIKGDPVAPGVTLTALEARIPLAGRYLRAVQAQRYAGGSGPTAADRRELRRALTIRATPMQRFRTWWALRSS